MFDGGVMPRGGGGCGVTPRLWTASLLLRRPPGQSHHRARQRAGCISHHRAMPPDRTGGHHRASDGDQVWEDFMEIIVFSGNPHHLWRSTCGVRGRPAHPTPAQRTPRGGSRARVRELPVPQRAPGEGARPPSADGARSK